MKKTCALTGHRELPENFNKNAVYDKLESLIKDGCDEFLCGMAKGFDLLALECLVSLRQKYPITLVACIPFANHGRFPDLKLRAYYADILSLCDRKVVVSDKYFNGCYLVRDRYMVDACDVLFAYCTKQTGGTAYTVKYAQEQNIPVIFF